MKTIKHFFNTLFTSRKEARVFFTGLFFGVIAGVFLLEALVPDSVKIIKQYREETQYVKQLKKGEVTLARVLGREVTSEVDYLSALKQYRIEMKRLTEEAQKLALDPAVKAYATSATVEDTTAIESITNLLKEVARNVSAK